MQLDKIILDLGFFKLSLSLSSSLLFIIHSSFWSVYDDVFLSSPPRLTDALTERINERIFLGKVTTGSGTLRYYGLNMSQSDDYSICVDADDKLDSFTSLPLSRILRHNL